MCGDSREEKKKKKTQHLKTVECVVFFLFKEVDFPPHSLKILPAVESAHHDEAAVGVDSTKSQNQNQPCVTGSRKRGDGKKNWRIGGTRLPPHIYICTPKPYIIGILSPVNADRGCS